MNQKDNQQDLSNNKVRINLTFQTLENPPYLELGELINFTNLKLSSTSKSFTKLKNGIGSVTRKVLGDKSNFNNMNFFKKPRSNKPLATSNLYCFEKKPIEDTAQQNQCETIVERVDEESEKFGEDSKQLSQMETRETINPVRELNAIYDENVEQIFEFTKINSNFGLTWLEKNKERNLIDPILMRDIYMEIIYEDHSSKLTYGYMALQKDINDKMRAVLVDWLIDVHSQFKLSDETLFLAINTMDLYLSKKQIPKDYFQLLGITCLMIASKFTETNNIDTKNCIMLTDNTYTLKEIKLMEKDVLKTINYNITKPTVLRCLELLSTNFSLSNKIYSLAKFLAEVFLLDYRITKYHPSHIACSIIYIIMKMNNGLFPNYKSIQNFTFSNYDSIKECAENIVYLSQHIDMENQYKAIKKKYYQVVNEMQN